MLMEQKQQLDRKLLVVGWSLKLFLVMGSGLPALECWLHFTHKMLEM